jgi:UrcA family protein
MNTLRLSIISGAAVLGLAVTAPMMAIAGTAEAPEAIKVSYVALNPSNKQDAAELYTRLQSAAKQVCAPYMVSQVNQYAARKACYVRVLSKAVHDVRERELSMLHAQAVHGGRSGERLASGGSASASVSK